MSVLSDNPVQSILSENIHHINNQINGVTMWLQTSSFKNLAISGEQQSSWRGEVDASMYFKFWRPSSTD